MKNRLRPLLAGAGPFLAVFAAVVLLDLLLQKGARSQLEEYFDNPFLDALNILGVMLKWGLLLSAPALLLGRKARLLYLPLWCWFVFLETVECVARIWYGMTLDGDWLMIVLTSSAAEMREFWGQFGVGSVLVLLCGALMVLALGGFFFLRVRYPPRSKASVLLGVLFCVPFLFLNLVFANPLSCANEVMFAFLPVDTVHNYALFRDVVRMAEAPRLPPVDAHAAERAKETLGVFVIGESATRNHWHLYGYGRPTTPMMEDYRSELVVFRDVRALASTTGKSLRMLLTEATGENPAETRSTFSQQCAAVGYRCRLFSAHSRWGRWEGVETLLFSGCETKCYLYDQPNVTSDDHDDALLPLFYKALEMPSDSGQVLFLHLMGSHAPPILRYPLKRSVYPRHEGDLAPGVEEPGSLKAALCDMYDNSIAFTDVILGDILDRLKSFHRPSFFVYLSDHGETPNSGFWRDKSSPDLYEVPCVVWFSPAYAERYPEIVAAVRSQAEKPIGMDHLLPIFRALVHLERM